MAAREDQAKLIIPDGELLRRLVVCTQQSRLEVPLTPGCLSAKPIDSAIPSGHDDPTLRAWREPSVWPELQRRRERVSDGIFGELDIAERSNEDRDGTPVVL